jgi:hypothetical protein
VGRGKGAFAEDRKTASSLVCKVATAENTDRLRLDPEPLSSSTVSPLTGVHSSTKGCVEALPACCSAHQLHRTAVSQQGSRRVCLGSRAPPLALGVIIDDELCRRLHVSSAHDQRDRHLVRREAEGCELLLWGRHFRLLLSGTTLRDAESLKGTSSFFDLLVQIGRGATPLQC